MATFISTLQFTERGIQGIRDTCEREEAFKAAAQKLGVQVSAVYWTPGAFDGLIVLEAPDGETAAAAMLHLAAQGNVRTQMTRAFTAAEMSKILARLPR